MPHLAICHVAAEVYATPSDRAQVIHALQAGTAVQIIDVTGDWYRLELEGGEGFVHATRLAQVEQVGGFLAAEPTFQMTSVEVDSSRRLDGAGGRAAALARAWNLYGGLLEPLSQRLGIDPAAATSVLLVESSGHGYGADGRVIIRFENHIFRRYLGVARRAEFDRHFAVGTNEPWLDHRYRRSARGPWRAFHGSQELEWDAFDVARGIDEPAALRSISMGLPQVMGFNHALVGYRDPAHMLAFMGAEVRFQLLALFDFIRGGQERSRAVTALQREDYDAFAALYNGPGQARYYGELIESHVAAFRSLRPVGSEEPPPSLSEPGHSTAAAVEGGATRTYEVRPGDTVSAIAGRFAVPISSIVAANKIANPDLVHVGQRLIIPAAAAAPASTVVPSAPAEDVTSEGESLATATYVVRPGDTLSRIAQAFGRSVPQLAEANRIEDVNLIFPGQVLAIP